MIYLSILMNYYNWNGIRRLSDIKVYTVSASDRLTLQGLTLCCVTSAFRKHCGSLEVVPPQFVLPKTQALHWLLA